MHYLPLLRWPWFPAEAFDNVVGRYSKAMLYMPHNICGSCNASYLVLICWEKKETRKTNDQGELEMNFHIPFLLPRY